MRKSIAFACILLLLAGCAKNEVLINESSPNIGNSGGSQSTDDGVLITFSASLENRKTSRAMSPMSKGLVSEIYAFKSADIGLKEVVTEGLYVTSSLGLLTGTRGYKMYLPNGNYNLYALSDNSTSAPPLVTNGMSAPLKNGVDYLWWENIGQDVSTSQVHVPIVFQHIATQVVIDISATENIKLDSLVSATILPPAPGQRLDFKTGIIESSTSFDTSPVNMGINKFIVQYIMLPIKIDAPMALTLKILVDGETVPRTYTVGIPISGKLVGGFSYVFKAVIDGNSVTFPNVSIKDWTEVDETGNPLYPSQN